MRLLPIRSISTVVALAALFGSLASVPPIFGQTNSEKPPGSFNARLAAMITHPSLGNAGLDPRWISPDWPDPGIKIADVSFNGLPMSEVALQLLAQFKNRFDIIIAGSSQNPAGMNPVADMDTATGGTLNLAALTVNLHLKNVSATELFNAMNLALEAENTDARWELRMNGSRPLALLKVYHPAMSLPRAVPSEKQREVYFVGDLLTKGETMPQLYKTICSVYDMAYSSGINGTGHEDIKFHDAAQLIIVNAVPERVAFVFETLKALREKIIADRRAESGTKK